MELLGGRGARDDYDVIFFVVRAVIAGFVTALVVVGVVVRTVVIAAFIVVGIVIRAGVVATFLVVATFVVIAVVAATLAAIIVAVVVVAITAAFAAAILITAVTIATALAALGKGPGHGELAVEVDRQGGRETEGQGRQSSGLQQPAHPARPNVADIGQDLLTHNRIHRLILLRVEGRSLRPTSPEGYRSHPEARLRWNLRLVSAWECQSAAMMSARSHSRGKVKAAALLATASLIALLAGMPQAAAEECGGPAAPPSDLATPSMLYETLSSRTNAELLAIGFMRKPVERTCTWVYEVKMLTASGSVVELDFNADGLGLVGARGPDNDRDAADLVKTLGGDTAVLTTGAAKDDSGGRGSGSASSSGKGSGSSGSGGDDDHGGGDDGGGDDGGEGGNSGTGGGDDGGGGDGGGEGGDGGGDSGGEGGEGGDDD